MIRAAAFCLCAVAAAGFAADIDDALLPNGEPVVGVYYYPWYSGPPFRHIAWTPEFEYDNINNPDHIHSVLRTITDYGINHAAFSYWNNAGSMDTLRRTFEQNEKLFADGRRLFISPYLEPPTIDKRFGLPAADAANIDFISKYLDVFGKQLSLARLGGKPFTNIYVTYYEPTVPGGAKPGTPEFVALQQARIEQLQRGWKAVRDGVKARTGFDTLYTGDCSQSNVGLTEYMTALSGLTWYAFDQAIHNPFARPKVASEVARYTGATMLYTIAPGYVDRQQRWPGARIEREPFLYPYAWCSAINTLPEGIMILTHSEWFEGSNIDVTREYGKQHYEQTELYSSIFRNAFPSIWQEKHRKKPVAVVYNEYAPFRLHDNGAGADDTYGIVKALQTLSLDFDVIPEKFLASELAGHQLVIVPCCGLGVAPESVKVLNEWGGGRLLYTALDGSGPAPFKGGTALPARYGQMFLAKLKAEGAAGGSIKELCAEFSETLRKAAPDVMRSGGGSSDYEITRGPVLHAGDTLLFAAVNAFPWEFLAEQCPTGRGITSDHSDEHTPAWQRRPVTFHVPLGEGRGRPVAEVMAIDSDSGRFRPVKFSVLGRQMRNENGLEREDETLLVDDSVKFHAIYAAVLCPVRLKFPPLTIHPGETLKHNIELANLVRVRSDGVLRLKAAPGLKMADKPFSIPENGTASVEVEFAAAPDYATGNRTVVFEVEIAGRKALFWRPVTCTPGPILTTRTTRVIGVAGQQVTQQIALVNIGGADATDIEAAVADGSAKLDKLGPGNEAVVEMTVTLPNIDPSRKSGPALLWSAAAPAIGLRPLRPSDGDGQVTDATHAGRKAIIADSAKSTPEQPVQYIYFAVDKAICPAGDYDYLAEVEYFDEGSGAFVIEYDSTDGDTMADRFKDSRSIALADTRLWRKASVRLPGCKFAGQQNYGADLRVSGVVPVFGLKLSPLPRPLVQAMAAELKLRYRGFGRELTQTLPVSLLSASPPAPPSGQSRLPRPTLCVVNPYDLGAVRSVPVTVDEKRLGCDRWRSVFVYDEAGFNVPCERREGKISFSAPVRGQASMFTFSAAQMGTAAKAGLRVVDMSEGKDGFLVVENEYLSLLFDEARGGMLMSLVDRKADVEYAAHPAGACVVQYETPKGGLVLSSQFTGEVTCTEKRRDHVLITCKAKTDALIIKDEWQVRAGNPSVHLKRRVTLLRDVAATDFVPLNLRLDAAQLDTVLPCGVGSTQGDSKFGTLETWHVADGYFAYRGSHLAASSAVGLAVINKSAIKRVHYGFFGNELQMRLRAHSPLAYGEDIDIEVELFAGSDLHYEYGHERALLHRSPAMIWVQTQGQALPAGQTVVPRAPVYMLDVRRPEF